MNSDRYYELKLLALEPYWRELLTAWLGSILILAIIRSVLFWMGKSKPGEFAKFLGLAPTLTVMVLYEPLSAVPDQVYLFNLAQTTEPQPLTCKRAILSG